MADNDPAGARRFAAGVALAAIVILVVILADYSLNWVHPEWVTRDLPNAVSNGTVWQAEDWWRGFDCWHFDGACRARFVSYFMQLATIKFRLWLFQWLVPHPTLSLAWLFSLLLAPRLLFLLLLRLTGSRATAWLGLAFYLLSPGTLSTTLMVLHPAKPLANFFLIACLFFAEYSRRRPAAYPLLLVTLALALCTDESSFFIVLCLPLLLFRRADLRFPFSWRPLAFLAVPVAFLLLVTFMVPRLTARLGYGTFDYWGYLLHGHLQGENFPEGKPAPRPLIASVSFTNLLRNSHGLLATHYLPYITTERYPESPAGASGFRPPGYISRISHLLVLLIAAGLACGLPPPRRRLAIRLVFCLLAFMIFHTALNARHLVVVPECFYYGASGSILIAMLAAVLMAGRWRPLLSRLLPPLLLLIFLWNTYHVNRDWRDWHYGTAAGRQQVLSFTLVRKAWRQRDQPAALSRLRAHCPPHAAWLFAELPLIP